MKNITTPKFQPEGVRVVRNFNIRDGEFVDQPAFFTSEKEYHIRIARAVPQPGDILFSREAPVGEACVIPDKLRVSLGQRTMLLRTDISKLDASFMVHNFYSPNIRKRMFAIASGLTVAHLNVSDIRSLPIPVPDLTEQKKIALQIESVVNKMRVHRRKRSSRSATGVRHVSFFVAIRTCASNRLQWPPTRLISCIERGLACRLAVFHQFQEHMASVYCKRESEILLPS
jgi:restriction endonuclease S subunit